jgi:hypothetical protein
MNRYCNHLNLDFLPLFKETVDINQFKLVRHTKGNLKFHLHPVFLDFLNSINLQAGGLEMFYSNPNFIQGIHIDDTGNERVKLNYIYGGKNSFMNWYDIKDNVVPVIKQTRTGSSYVEFTEDEVNLVYQSNVKFPSLVQVGIPHNIINPTEHRLCVSVLLYRNNSCINMTDAIESFKQYMI